ncbi:MAG: hypothetical protein ACYSWU_20050, partial [Planctomycetota bacterium]
MRHIWLQDGAASYPTELPDPWIGTNDDVQYFPPGPEFKLAREAAAIQQQRDEGEGSARESARE